MGGGRGTGGGGGGNLKVLGWWMVMTWLKRLTAH